MSTKVLKTCPFCHAPARDPKDAPNDPWDEYGYTHCLGKKCPSVNSVGDAWRVPINLWEQLPRTLTPVVYPPACPSCNVLNVETFGEERQAEYWCMCCAPGETYDVPTWTERVERINHETV